MPYNYIFTGKSKQRLVAKRKDRSGQTEMTHPKEAPPKDAEGDDWELLNADGTKVPAALVYIYDIQKLDLPVFFIRERKRLRKEKEKADREAKKKAEKEARKV